MGNVSSAVQWKSKSWCPHQQSIIYSPTPFRRITLPGHSIDQSSNSVSCSAPWIEFTYGHPVHYFLNEGFPEGKNRMDAAVFHNFTLLFLK